MQVLHSKCHGCARSSDGLVDGQQPRALGSVAGRCDPYYHPQPQRKDDLSCRIQIDWIQGCKIDTSKSIWQAAATKYSRQCVHTALPTHPERESHSNLSPGHLLNVCIDTHVRERMLSSDTGLGGGSRVPASTTNT